MSNFGTELMSALFKGESIDEVMRVELESAVNDLLKLELTGFQDYEKYDPIGYNSGNSRNETYSRQMKTRFGDITVDIPRDRNGEYKQHTVPLYKRSTDDLESIIIRMVQRGITTSEISELIERMYGTYYTPQTNSNIAQVLSDQVEVFYKQPISPCFVCVYLGATYLALRRDTVSKRSATRHRGDQRGRHQGNLGLSTIPHRII